MFKQTVLKFQGALGLLGFGHKDDQEDGDSGNSTPTGFSDDEIDGNPKISYEHVREGN